MAGAHGGFKAKPALIALISARHPLSVFFRFFSPIIFYISHMCRYLLSVVIMQLLIQYLYVMVSIFSVLVTAEITTKFNLIN